MIWRILTPLTAFAPVVMATAVMIPAASRITIPPTSALLHHALTPARTMAAASIVLPAPLPAVMLLPALLVFASRASTHTRTAMLTVAMPALPISVLSLSMHSTMARATRHGHHAAARSHQHAQPLFLFVGEAFVERFHGLGHLCHDRAARSHRFSCLFHALEWIGRLAFLARAIGHVHPQLAHVTQCGLNRRPQLCLGIGQYQAGLDRCDSCFEEGVSVRLRHALPATLRTITEAAAIARRWRG